MSRNVDASDLTVLSEEDLAYLESRGQVHVARQVEAERRRRAKNVVVEEVDLPYSKWGVDELRDELNNRRLSTEGKKPELVQRLEKDDEKQD